MKALDRLLGLRLRKRRRLALLFAYSFAGAAAYLVSRTAADSIFLSRVGPQDLPALHLLSAGCVGVISLAYGGLVRKFRLFPTIRLTLLAMAAASIALGLAEQGRNPSAAVAVTLYVFVQLRGALGTVQFIAILAEQGDGERPERIHGLVAAGATLAGISSGLLITGITQQHASIAIVMFLAACFDGLGFLLLRGIERRTQQPSMDPRASKAAAETPALRFDARIVWPLAVMLVLMFVVLTSVEIVWKIVVADLLERNEQDLARYFGIFYGALYLFTGTAQLLATARVMKTLGPRRAFIVLPAAVTLALGGVAGVAQQTLVLGGMTIAKGCDLFRRSLHDPAMQAVYSGLRERTRHSTIVLLGGVIKPCAEAVTAAALVPLVQLLPPRQLAAPVLVLSLCWLAQSAYLSYRTKTA